ncbi:MAG: helix-turn-helix domain-containing protein [Hyphomicrobiaceae bacterium]
MEFAQSQTFDDTEILSHALRDTNVSAMQINRGKFEATLTQYRIGEWSFQHISFGAGQTSCRGESPSHAAAFLIPLRSQPQAKLLGTQATENTIGIYGPNSEHADISCAGVSLMVVAIPKDTFKMELIGSRTLELDSVTKRLRRLLVSVQETAENRPHALEKIAVRRCITDELSRALSPTLLLHCTRGRTGRPELPRRAIIQRIKEVLETNSGEPMFADELSAAVGVSEPTLRRIFLDWYGLPPARYLLLRRYYLARARLRSGDAKTVGEAAGSCGFWDLSRFSGGYREIFGEPPSREISRLRLGNKVSSRATPRCS